MKWLEYTQIIQQHLTNQYILTLGATNSTIASSDSIRICEKFDNILSHYLIQIYFQLIPSSPSDYSPAALPYP